MAGASGTRLVKPVPFAYDAPRSVDEALALAAEHGDEAKLLAGGQSLVPLLNFRLLRPARLIDLNGVEALAGIDAGETLRLGAMTRARALERSPEVAARWPLLVQAMRFSGHPQIRNRGTVGGSCAHADPASELPCALLALDARMRLRSERGERTVDARDFFLSTFWTALEPGELLVEIQVPALSSRTGTAFLEYTRVHGDFALAGAAAVVTLGEGGAVERAAVALCAVADRPIRVPDAEAALAGRRLDDDAAREAGALAAAAAEPTSRDAEYRRALGAELVRRALLDAAGRAAA